VILAPLSVFESEGIQLQLSRTGRETGVAVAAANLGFILLWISGSSSV